MSLMCHPQRSPKISVPEDPRYDLFVNNTPNYAEAYRVAIARAVETGMDLVTADTDGYHPPSEVAKLAAGDFGEGAYLVLPYRENIGWQSKTYSFFFSLKEGRTIRDVTGGLCRLSFDLMKSFPPLESADMTVHVEVLKRALGTGARLVQYGYISGANDEAESRRTSNYQWKLFKAAFG